MSLFSAEDESTHYAFSVCTLLQQYRRPLGWEEHGVAELGSGDAAAVADAVAALPRLRVHGYDISEASVQEARRNIAERGVAERYTVELGDFFDSADSAHSADSSGSARTRTVIANPPYLPAPDGDIRMPELWGGVYGNDLVLALLKARYENVIVAVASYADPAGTVAVAGDLGYRVANFLAMPLDLGPYSSEPKVARQIRRICAEGRGWAGEREYLVAVALFTQHPELRGDRSEQLLAALQLAG